MSTELKIETGTKIVSTTERKICYGAEDYLVIGDKSWFVKKSFLYDDGERAAIIYGLLEAFLPTILRSPCRVEQSSVESVLDALSAIAEAPGRNPF
jgi:hypothetical protein